MITKEEAHIKRRIKELRQREKEFRKLTIWYSANINHKRRDNQSN